MRDGSVMFHKEFLMNGLQDYFKSGRPREHKKFEAEYLDRFEAALGECGISEGIYIASHLFLFSYTLSNEYKIIQQKIYDRICLPYQNWVHQNFQSNHTKIKKGDKKNAYLFIVRHAITSGMYSPAQATYFMTKLMLEAGKLVYVISTGEVDEKFYRLKEKYPNFEIIQLKLYDDYSAAFNFMEGLCTGGLFENIFTDCEFSEPSFIAIRHQLDNMVLMSAGFYRVPWYAKILKPNVLGPAVGTAEISTPMPIEPDLLAPVIDHDLVELERGRLGFTQDDMIFGCFARLEKFTQAYVDIAKFILDKFPQSKLLIAGTNEQDFLRSAFKAELATNRLTLLGFSNSHLLGNLLSFGLETLPTLSGSTVLELYAKSKIVLTSKKDVTDIDYIRKARINDFVYSDKKGLDVLLNDFMDIDKRKSNEEKSKKFIEDMGHVCRSEYLKIIDSL